MSRVIRRLAATAGAVSCLVVPVVAVASPPDPSTLPSGLAPTVRWQSGTTVHLPNGKTVRLPLGKPGAVYEVLGKRGGEWIVLTTRYHPRVLAVRGTRVRTVRDLGDRETTGYTSSDYTLSERGSLVAEFNYHPSGGTDAVILDLTGKVVARKRWSGSVNLLDFEGDAMLVTNGAKTSTWSLPGRPVAVAPGAVYGDLGGDLMFTELGLSGLVGPTSISAPATPAWTTRGFGPMRLSPDRQYIAGFNYDDDKNVIEVRKVSDGTVLPLPPYEIADFALAWEPDGSLLFLAKKGPKKALVRCTLAGVCDRATGWVNRQHVGFPA